jgi:membrane protease YdiL (CAAX protease family)
MNRAKWKPASIAMMFYRTTKPIEAEVSIRPALIVPWWEIMMVAVPMLGVGIVVSAFYGLTHPAGSFYLLISDRFFLLNGGFQSFMLAGFLFFLRKRGWKPEDLRVRMGWITSLRGLELLVFTYGGFLAVTEFSRLMIWMMGPTPYVFLAHLFVPAHLAIPKGGFHLSWITLIVFTMLNAFYEELVYMGYGFNLWAAKYGPRTAVLFSILARLSVHTYQGSEHILPIGVWAVIFGVWYRYHRAVWPLILAHAMIDLISIGLLKVMYGAH